MAENPIRIADIDHVVIRAHDLDRLRAFYVEALGCPVERDRRDIGLLQLRAGRSLIDLVDVHGALGQQGSGVPEPGAPLNMDHLCLAVEPWDAEAILAHLCAHGAEPGGVERRYGARGYGPSIYVDDPEGNMVELKGPPEG